MIFHEIIIKNILILGMITWLFACGTDDTNPPDSDDHDQDGILNENDFFPLDDTRWAKATLELTDLNGSNGLVIDENYSSVSDWEKTGDINGDGFEDLLRGYPPVQSYVCPYSLGSGRAYVVFGDENGLPEVIDPSLLDGSNGFLLHYCQDGTGVGQSVSAGDINGDEIDDLIIGASPAAWSHAPGKTFVVFGSKNIWPASIDLTLLDGSDGFVLHGIHDREEEWSGYPVDAADMNRDGIDDILIGSPGAFGIIGETYIIYGSNTSWPASIELSSLNGSNGFVVKGVKIYDYSGNSVCAGDINGDGLNDLVIGASGTISNESIDGGATYAVFGSNIGWPASIELSSLDGSNGFVVNGGENDRIGKRVNTDDINEDGLEDIIFTGENPDITYVVYGCNYTTHLCQK